MNAPIHMSDRNRGAAGKRNGAHPLCKRTAAQRPAVRLSLMLLAVLLAAGTIVRPAAAQRRGSREGKVPPGAIKVSHVDNSAEGKRSIAGSGHAVMFERPAGAKAVVAVQIFGSRYGHPQAPREDFHVYLLDAQQEVIKDLKFPYGMVERGSERWYTLAVPSVEVPERFYAAVSFNPERTKGVYLGIDENVTESHSFTGLPDRGFSRLSEGDWMIRVYFGPGGAAVGKVVEQVFPAASAGVSFVDLDQGKVIPAPAELAGTRDREAWLAWAKEKGVDASVRVRGDACQLGYIDACMQSTPNSRWESLTPALLARNRSLQEAEPGIGNISQAKGDMPATYLFKTREGGTGILQLVGFADDGQGVRVRFKRMQ